MPYKSEEQRRNATKEKVRRYREKRKGITKDVTSITPDVTFCLKCSGLEVEVAKLKAEMSAQVDGECSGCLDRDVEIRELKKKSSGKSVSLKKGNGVEVVVTESGMCPKHKRWRIPGSPFNCC